tara:strand:+ start:1999 stop:2778 length:780 start_codon:yes stop_codon:yes gene_type:complete
MSRNHKLKGLCLKSSPLGEYDRLITILSDEKGISRLAVPGARKPKSSLAAASPLTFLDLHVVGNKNLKKVCQIKILKSYCGLGKSIECLAASQAITELTFLLVGNDDTQNNYLSTVLAHLDRLSEYKIFKEADTKFLAMSIQSLIHLLAIGGLSLPIHYCCKTGKPIQPPIGNWEWICYFIPSEGFSLKNDSRSILKMNSSEVALLQRLLFPELPIKSNGELLGPKKVWERIFKIIYSWIPAQLGKELSSLNILKTYYL